MALKQDRSTSTLSPPALAGLLLLSCSIMRKILSGFITDAANKIIASDFFARHPDVVFTDNFGNIKIT